MYEYGPPTGCRVETLGANTSNSSGTNVATGGVAHTMGTAVSIGTAGFTYEAIQLLATWFGPSGDVLFDILMSVGGAADHVLAENIYLGMGAQTVPGLNVMLPLHVPAGAALSVRAQGSSTSQNIPVMLVGYSANHLGGPGYARMCVLGNNAAASRGISVTTGAANTKARTVLTASSAVEAKALGLMLSPSTASRFFLSHLETGSAASEEVIAPDIPFQSGAAASVPFAHRFFLFNRAVAASSRFSLHAQSGSASAVLYASLHAFQ